MLAQFSIVPIGSGSSLGDKVAAVLDMVARSGMPYKVNPMGTVLEGDWDEIKIPATKVPKFTAGKTLKDAVK